MNILILHGPNLNLLGKREPGIYGDLSLDDINEKLSDFAKSLQVSLKFVQSNHEGELIDALQDSQKFATGIVFNPGGYTHTSVAIRDAISSITIPVVEVHISNVAAREDFRKISLIGEVSVGTIAGFGWKSYQYGILAITDLI